MADNGRKTFVEPGLAALRRFLTTLPETAKEWPRQAFDMVRMPADLTLGGSPEEKAIEEARQLQGYADLRQGRVHSSPELSNLPASHGAANYRPGTPEARAHQVSEFINPIANSVFAPVKAAKGLKRGALELMNRALTPSPVAQAGAIKPRGGNWLTEGEGSINDFVAQQRAGLADDGERFAQVFANTWPQEGIQRKLMQARATNDWLSGPFTNYMKRDFAAETDPVRILADQGITHGKRQDLIEPTWFEGENSLAYFAKDSRNEAAPLYHGSEFTPRQMATTPAGTQWEDLADAVMTPVTKERARIAERLANPWLDKLGDTDVVNTLNNGTAGADLGVGNITKHFMDAMEEGTLKPEDLKQMSMEKAVRFVDARSKAKEAAFVAEMMETGRSPVYAGAKLKEAPDGSYITELGLPKELTDDMRKLVRQNKDGTWSALTPSGKVMQRRIRPGEESPLIDVVEDTPEKALLGGMLGHEGRTMKHCVGGYCDEVANGNTRVISMRGPDGQSHVTMEVMNGPNEDTLVSQIYGQANSTPKAEYLPLIQDFIKASGYDVDPQALKNAGLIDLRGEPKPQGLGDFVTKEEWDELVRQVDIAPPEFKSGGLMTDEMAYPGVF